MALSWYRPDIIEIELDGQTVTMHRAVASEVWPTFSVLGEGAAAVSADLLRKIEGQLASALVAIDGERAPAEVTIDAKWIDSHWDVNEILGLFSAWVSAQSGLTDDEGKS